MEFPARPIERPFGGTTQEQDTVMRCPKCGNELNREEAFCGQCGAPTMLPTRPPQTADAPPPRTSGLLRSYNTQNGPNNSQPAPPSNAYNTNNPQAGPYDTLPAPSAGPNPPGMMPPPASAYNLRTSPPSQPLRPPVTGSQAGQPSSPSRSSNLHQPTGFYQDATEAMVVSPMNGNPNYPQNGYPAAPPQRQVPTMYNPQMQPFQAGNQTSAGYPPLQAYPSGQGYNYGMPPNVTPPHDLKRAPLPRSNVFLIIVCIMFVFAFLIAAVVGGLYLLRNQSSQTPTPASTSAPTATTIPSPTPSLTPISSPTPTSVPSPTLTPTPAPAPGFSYCDASCTTNGYSVEYPSTWQEGTTSDSTGVEFKNPQAHDEYAAFKATGSTGDTATDLVNNDLQNNFASQPDYTAPTASQSTTIGGVTWVYSVATYTLNNQAERIEVFATVRQGKDYIIELQAPDSQFDNINSAYFVTMLGNFQFLSGS
jgi:hypothetical protein